MAQQHSSKGQPASDPVSQAQRDSFDPKGPHGGFGGAGGSQGSVYEPKHKSGQQRREHEAWRQHHTQAERHGGVKPGDPGPYGDYGEVQGHDAGYWLGGGDKDRSPEPSAKPSTPSSAKR
jgi:hypothetical protein